MRADSIPLTPSRLAPVLRPVYAFLSAESSGGIVLLLATLVAMGWANSFWGQTYHDFWQMTFTIGAGDFGYALSLEHWVDEGLMVVFFLLVGLEIKRELLIGELASWRRAGLPIAAALGGMIAPACIYASFNHAGPGLPGWGIPMATDIAFAVGVLAMVGRAVPTSIKVFLLAVAIVDDLGAVIVIALFYTQHISPIAIAIAAAFLAGLILLNLLRVHHPFPYLLLGVGLWAATMASGIHATIAGVLLALTIPATRQIEEAPYLAYVREMLDVFEREMRIDPGKITQDQSDALNAMERASQAVQTPLARVEHALLKPVNFLIIPLFALANAGLDIRPAHGIGSNLHDPVAWGVFLGLLLGKPLGVLLASWIAVACGVATLPAGATRRHIVGLSVLCGIGFTMSLFVASLAFATSPTHLNAAKSGILGASLISGLIGAAIIAAPARKTSLHSSLT